VFLPKNPYWNCFKPRDGSSAVGPATASLAEAADMFFKWLHPLQPKDLLRTPIVTLCFSKKITKRVSGGISNGYISGSFSVGVPNV